MKNENSVKLACKKYLKARDIQHITVTTNGFGSSGWPDICFLYRGVFVGIECKFGKNKPSALQEQKLDYIKAQGGIAMLVNEENIGDVGVVLECIEWAQRDEEETLVPRHDALWGWVDIKKLKLWRD